MDGTVSSSSPISPSAGASTASRTSSGFSSFFYANVTSLGDKAWKYLMKGKYDYVSVVETHISETSFKQWDKKARAAGYRILANHARARRKKVAASMAERANEGGEWFMSKAHLQVESRYSDFHTGAQLRAAGHNQLDGFQVSIIHMRGYPIAVFTFYGLPSLGFTGANVQRFKKLGAVINTLQIPYIIIGDFNVQVAAMQKSVFLSKLVGEPVILKADNVSCACEAGKVGSIIDYVICSSAARSYIGSVKGVANVPWKPHLGLMLELRSSGQQLITRQLELPVVLPQRSRPATEPTPGSKSSRCRQENEEKTSLDESCQESSVQRFVWG